MVEVIHLNLLLFRAYNKCGSANPSFLLHFFCNPSHSSPSPLPVFFTSHPPLTAGSVSSLCWRIWSDGGIQHAESGLALFLNGSGLVEDNYSYTSWLSKVTIRVSRAFESDK